MFGACNFTNFSDQRGQILISHSVIGQIDSINSPFNVFTGKVNQRLLHFLILQIQRRNIPFKSMDKIFILLFWFFMYPMNS